MMKPLLFGKTFMIYGKTFDLPHGLIFLFWQIFFPSWLNLYLLTQLFLFMAKILTFNKTF